MKVITTNKEIFVFKCYNQYCKNDYKNSDI